MRPDYSGRKLAVVGAYGSGKTEFALNLALQLAANLPLALVDLDIVNPYFRSRDATEVLEAHGVEVVYNRDLRTADLPALSPRVDAVLASPGTVIVDVGGDEGARVLGRYRRLLSTAEILMVINCFRPYTADSAGIIATASRLEDRSGLAITALVNNSNLGQETTPEHVRHGAAVVTDAARQMQVPVAYHCCRPWLVPMLPEFGSQLFALELSLFPADIT